LYSTKTQIITGKTTSYIKNSFIYGAAIAGKLDGKKQGAIEQNSEGFSTVSDEVKPCPSARFYRIAVETLTRPGPAENP
jgi:hypothetical protein